MNEKSKTEEQEKRDANRDPLTGAPGAHPVGTGIGATGGGAAGAAIGAAVGGPIGAAVGIVAGAVVGGLAGKSAAEAIDPTAEDAYWRENYRNREYVDRDADYEKYRPAYRVGYEGYSRRQGRTYDEVEPELRREYEQSGAASGLAWEKARHASRDAWHRVDKPAQEVKPANPPKPAGSSDPGCGCS